MAGKRASVWSALVASLAILSIMLGVFLMLLSFNSANTEMVEEHHSHLLDIARSTDRNVATLLEHTRQELIYAVSFHDSAERAFLDAGDTKAMQQYVSGFPVLQAGYVTSILTIYRGEVLLCSSGSGCGQYSFPSGVSTEIPCLCTDTAGTNYLAIAVVSPFSELIYAALIDLDIFYREIAGTELTDANRVMLFDESTGLVLRNSKDRPEVYHMSPQEALARNDGISILVSSELEQKTFTRQYKYTDSSGVTSDRLIAVIPTSENINGVFAIGLASDYEHIHTFLQSTFNRLALSGILILAGIVALISVISRSHREAAEIARQIEVLQDQNKTLLETAHRQRLEMIGTMTSSIAHEFNNMLTPIMSYSILTMEQLPDGSEELMDNLTEIYDASSRAKTLISRLSALSRKNNEAAYRLFSPDALVEKVLDMTRPSLPKNVELEKKLTCPDASLFADETQIGQLLLNLIINAFQAMEDVGGTLTVSTECKDGQILLRVRDTGPGIPEEIIDHIYEPFFTTKDLGRGTGLGLAISAQIAAEHKGSIAAESSHGHGTCFTVTLPCNCEK